MIELVIGILGFLVTVALISAIFEIRRVVKRMYRLQEAQASAEAVARLEAEDSRQSERQRRETLIVVVAIIVVSLIVYFVTQT